MRRDVAAVVIAAFSVVIVNVDPLALVVGAVVFVVSARLNGL